MKKRIVCLILSLCMIFALMTCAQAQMRIKILCGKSELICDVPPMIVNDRTMVPLRAIFEAIGAEVEYEDETRKITATKDDTTVVLHVDSDVMLVNEKEVTLDAPAFISGDRTLVPLRACAESFGLDVEWWGDARTVKIKRGAYLMTESENHYGDKEIRKYDERGNLIEEVRFGQTGTYTYDEYDNELSLSVSGGYGHTKTYDVYGNMITYSSMGTTSTYTYDDNRRVVTESTTSRMSPIPTVYTYTYDEAGHMILKQSDSGYFEKYTYDEKGNLLCREISGGQKREYTYDENGQMLSSTDSDGSRVIHEYDERGNLILQTDSIGTETRYTYDEFDRPVRLDMSDGFWETYTYDEQGRRAAATNRSYTTTYTYDEHGNLILEEMDTGEFISYTYEYIIQ